ncbi:MAG: hypothetical protein JWM68_5739, partial [Verrucomicrobiales bacterium]|nr:hypothetical protein [Verrucomicrobiales bacterium]
SMSMSIDESNWLSAIFLFHGSKEAGNSTDWGAGVNVQRKFRVLPISPGQFDAGLWRGGVAFLVDRDELDCRYARKINVMTTASSRSVVVQTVVLAVGAFLFFLLAYGVPTSNAVMRNYTLGGKSFIQGQNPYEVTALNGPSNQFKYSPLFALLMAGMAQPKAQEIVVGLWILAGMGTFCLGLSRWSELKGKLQLSIALAVVACLLELMFSMVLTQANALIVGLILIGVAEYRSGRLFSAGAILLLATNFKVYPVIFLVALAMRPKRAYLLGVLCAGVVAFLLPAFFVGWSHNMAMHVAWVQVVMGDAAGGGILDVASALQRAGLATLGQVLRWVILIISVPLFFGYVLRVREVDWRPWVTFGVASILLLSPRTEVFTFVLLAPAYVLMVGWCVESGKKWIRTYGAMAFAVLGWMITSCAYTDANWLVSEGPIEIWRVMGALGFWVLTAVILGRAVGKSSTRIASVCGAETI